MDFLIFIAVIAVLIVVHEWGHYFTARKLGVKVEEFAVGFGKKLFSWRSDGTEFKICAIPLGGYVKMAGDERDKCKGSTDEFYSKPVGHRALIVLMGPVINYVFAYICLYFIFLIGYPVISPKVGELLEGYPAQVAGLQAGDRVVRINSRGIESFEDIQAEVMTAGIVPLTFEIERNGIHFKKVLTPKPQVEKNIFGREQKVGLIGIRPQDEVFLLKKGPLQSFGKAATQLWSITTMTLKAVYRIITGATPAKDSLAGPVQIFEIIKKAYQEGFVYLIFITAIISTNLAIFNLFPIPVLDGGHLFLMGIEKIRGRPVSPKIEMGMIRFGMGLLLFLLVFVVYNDLVQVGVVEALVKLWSQITGGRP